jgi:hypothetical protein
VPKPNRRGHGLQPPDKAFADLLELFCHRCNSLEHVQCRGGHYDGLVGLLVCEQELDLSGQTGERFRILARNPRRAEPAFSVSGWPAR